jgi:hypothetical protein
VVRPRYNAIHREALADRLDACVDRSVAVCPYAAPAKVALRWLMDRERFTCVPTTAARGVA